MLTFQSLGEGDPLMIVHGLYGSGRNWGAIAKRLSDHRRVITPDMRNHAHSFRADSHGYGDLAGDLAELIRAEGAPMDVIGHSMGGKAAMRLALTRPDLINRLIVADIAPVAYGHSQQEYIDAMRAVDLSDVTKRSEADALLKPHVPDPGTRAFLLQSLDVAEKRWRLNLDVLEREMSRITGWEEVAGVFDGPTLFLSGGESDYVRAEYRDKIKTQFPKAKFAKIPGAGHWLHAEKPREFEAAARAFFKM